MIIKMNCAIFILFALIMIKQTRTLVPSDVLILILSQRDSHNNMVAANLRANLYNQSALINANNLINIYLTHEAFKESGHWTLLAILPSLINKKIILERIKWLVLCEDKSHVDLALLLEKLSEEDFSKIKYIGYPLYDREATIIHHYAFFENPQWFPYPLLRSGVIFSIPLIKKLSEYTWKAKPNTDFFIDASHELSLFVWQNIKTDISQAIDFQISRNEKESINCINFDPSKEDIENNKRKMQLQEHKKQYLLMETGSYLCSHKKYGCAIYPSQTFLKCNAINPGTIYFAIKTCKKYHKERIPTIKQTWGQYAIHKTFFSDQSDNNIPTISTGIPNTETGHCNKTLSILKLVIINIERMNAVLSQPIEWVLLADDDTLLSISRLSEILGCFNSTNDLYIGERYGYRLHSKDGFNYITGGGGIAFSLSTVRRIIKTCACPTISSPDDMIIGVCLQRQGITATHSSSFHQARPTDYSGDLLSIETPVSFHKFWQIDPKLVYERWFMEADKSLNTCMETTLCSSHYDKRVNNDNILKNVKQHFDL